MCAQTLHERLCNVCADEMVYRVRGREVVHGVLFVHRDTVQVMTDILCAFTYCAAQHIQHLAEPCSNLLLVLTSCCYTLDLFASAHAAARATAELYAVRGGSGHVVGRLRHC